MNKVEALAALFGGKAELARLVERHPSIISRWVRRGKVPHQWNHFLMLEAHDQRIDTDVADLLEPDACPTCGKPL